MSAVPSTVAGGRARAQALSPQQRSDIARRAAEARWKNRPAMGPVEIDAARTGIVALEAALRLFQRAGCGLAAKKVRQAIQAAEQSIRETMS